MIACVSEVICCLYRKPWARIGEFVTPGQSDA